MRWLVLYSRSRQVPAAAAALVVSTVLVWLLAHRSWSLLPASLAITSAAALGSIGLSGQDVDLDRTAAIRWPLRRFGHLALIGATVAVVVLAVQRASTEPVATGLVLRNTAGTLGLAAIAATVLGGQFGWTLPLAWLAIAPFVPPGTTAGPRIAAWMLQPAGTAAATWTAAILCCAGTALYTVLGARRA